MKTEVRTKFGYKYIINMGVELLTNEVKEYLFNFNPILFHNDMECYHWFFDQKINNTEVWIESRNIDLTNDKIEINLYK